MSIAAGPIGQIAFAVRSADSSEAFYGTTLGLRRWYRFGGLVFFDAAVGLMIDGPPHGIA